MFLISGCCTVANTNSGAYSAIQIIIAEDTLDGKTSGMPDLILTVLNRGTKAGGYGKARKPFLGEVVVVCNSQTNVLQDRSFLRARFFGTPDVTGEYLAPNGSYTTRLKLEQDYLTEDEFKAEVLRQVSSMDSPRKPTWTERIKVNGICHIYLRDTACGLISNEIAVKPRDKSKTE